MPGLAAYALAGAAAGYGKGLVERAQALREEALADERHDQGIRDRFDLQQNASDLRRAEKGLPPIRLGGESVATPSGKSGGSGGAKRASGTSSPAKPEASGSDIITENGKPYAAPGARVVNRYQAEDGTWRGFVGGQEVYMRGPDGSDMKGGDPDRNPELAPVEPAAPKVDMTPPAAPVADDNEAALAAARAAIAKGAPRAAVEQRLRENGIDPSGL